MATSDTGLPDNTLAYTHTQGGLNNQKLAIYGLLLKAFPHDPRSIILPDLLLFDLHAPFDCKGAFHQL
jgi:hypothetical protein